MTCWVCTSFSSVVRESRLINTIAAYSAITATFSQRSHFVFAFILQNVPDIDDIAVHSTSGRADDANGADGGSSTTGRKCYRVALLHQETRAKASTGPPCPNQENAVQACLCQLRDGRLGECEPWAAEGSVRQRALYQVPEDIGLDDEDDDEMAESRKL